MSLAIKFGDESDKNSLSGAIYFDAVTDYSKVYAGKVTEHPIEAGASVSDHFISQNPKYRISGVISSVDFSVLTQGFSLDGTPVMNINSRPPAVIVDISETKLRDYIPGVIAQFLPSLGSQINISQESLMDHKDSVEQLLQELMNGLYYNEDRQRWENRMTTTTLYEIVGGVAVKPVKDLVMTNFSVKETVESGDALFVDMDFEQVRFVTLEKAEAPKAQKGTPEARATKGKSNKGKANSTPVSKTDLDTKSVGTAAQQKAPSVRGSLDSAEGAFKGKANTPEGWKK